MQARSSPMRTTSSFYSTNMTNEIIRKAATILNVNYDQLYEANSYFKNSNLQTKTLNIMYFVGYFTHEDFEKKFEEKIDKWLWAVHNQVAYYYSKLDRPFKIAVQSIRYLSFKENRELTVLGMPKFLKKYRGYSDKKLINYDVIVYLSNGFNMGDGFTMKTLLLSSFIAAVCIMQARSSPMRTTSSFYSTNMTNEIIRKAATILNVNYDQLYEANSYFKNSNLQTKTLNIMYFVGYFTEEDFEEKFEEKIDKWLWAVHNQA